jgi:uncharacterized C2H2 Zn-finger protein
MSGILTFMVSILNCVLSRYMAVTVDSLGATRFACIRCNKTFAQKSYIKEHMKIHTGTFNPRERK